MKHAQLKPRRARFPGLARPNTMAEDYMKAGQETCSPYVDNKERYRRVLAASFSGLIARMKHEGWGDELIKAAAAQSLGDAYGKG